MATDTKVKGKTPPGQDTPPQGQPQGQDTPPQVVETPIDPMQAKMESLAKALGIYDVTLLANIKPQLEEALKAEEERWGSVAEALKVALGEFKAFTTVMIHRNPDGSVTIERDPVKAAKATTNGVGTGNHFQGTVISLPLPIAGKYKLATTYPSRRSLAHAVAKSLGKELPKDNATARYIQRNAPDLWEAIGKPQD